MNSFTIRSFFTFCFQLVITVNNLSMEKADKSKIIEENKALKIELEQKLKELDDLSRNADEYK